MAAPPARWHFMIKIFKGCDAMYDIVPQTCYCSAECLLLTSCFRRLLSCFSSLLLSHTLGIPKWKIKSKVTEHLFRRHSPYHLASITLWYPISSFSNSFTFASPVLTFPSAVPWLAPHWRPVLKRPLSSPERYRIIEHMSSSEH